MSGFFAPLADPAFLLSSVYLGIGCILVSSATINYTFRILPAAKAGIFNNISTVISILAGGLILHEPLTIVHIVCAAVVITAAIIINGRKDQLT
jgi:drug/metabolite transporter (DMT)-like permease